MKKTILAYGELLWDLLPTGKALGGATTNFIFRINQFGDNGFLVSRIGDDENGQEAIEKLIELGLAVHHVQTDPDLPTGTVPVTLNAEGVPQFTIIRNVAYDHIVLTGDMLHLGSMADCIYFGTLSQRTEQSKNTLRTLLQKTPDAIKFLDINLRKDCYSPEIIKESLELATILKINDQELITLKEMFNLSGNSLQELSQELVSRHHLTLALVTLGEKGAFVMTNKGHYSYDPGYRVNVVDTVGAGDACSAGFM
ncbi:MAG: carbohydrate kinase, partial [Prolixibacteraceae bacterium]